MIHRTTALTFTGVLRAAGNYWGDIYRDNAAQSCGSRASVRQWGLLVLIGEHDGKESVQACGD